MKKILLPLLLFPVLAIGNDTGEEKDFAFLENKMVCVRAEVVYSSLDEFGERPMMHMVSHRRMFDESVSSYPTIMFVNPNTGTWSLVEKHTEEILCIVAIGQQMRPYGR
jgi:hypothetical protein